MTGYLMIALGSALGGAGRYWANALITRKADSVFPWGTFLVNSLGALFVGLFTAAIIGPGGLPGEASLLLVVGLCGSFTTVSSFSLQTLALAKDGRWSLAALNVVGSMTTCLAMAWLGISLGRLVWGGI